MKGLRPLHASQELKRDFFDNLRLLPFGRRLLLSCSLIALDRSSPLSQSATPDSRTQPCPRGTLIADQRGACTARPKGKYSRGRMALAPIRTREFSLPRGRAEVGGSAACQFYQLDFFVTAQPSLILSWAPRKNRTPYSKYRPPPYSSSRGTDASCTCVSFSATPRNSSFTSESSSGSAIVSDGVRLPPRMRVMSVSG